VFCLEQDAKGMYLMKKFIATLVLTAMTSSVFAQSIGVGGAANEFRRNLQKNLEDTKADMELHISSRRLDFSDYKAASEALLKRIEQTTQNFESDLKGVENFLSWYDSVNSAAGANKNNRAIQRLLEKKEDELKTLRQAYKTYAQNYVMMNGYLQFPISHKMAVIDMYKNRLVTVDAEWMEFEGRPGPRAKAWLESTLSRKSYELFSNCRSQGCVYYLAEDIALWIKKSQEAVAKLDIPVSGVKDFKADKQVKFKKIQNSIDAMADISAAGKPTSVQ
jgi:hypothetical protein